MVRSVSEAQEDRKEEQLEPHEQTTEDDGAGTRMTLAAIVIAIFGGIGKVLGYGREILIAHWWGRDAAVDAFVVVNNYIVVEIYRKFEQLLRPTYLPIFVRHKSSDQEERAWSFFRVVATISFVVMALIVVLAILGAPWILRTLWPALELHDLGTNLLRIAAAALLLLVMSVMAELTLHSHKEFTVPAMADAGRQVVFFGSIAGLVGFGIYAAGEPSGMKAAAIGVLVGGVVRLFVQVPALLKHAPTLRPAIPAMREIVPILVIMLFWWVMLLADGTRIVGRRLGVIDEPDEENPLLLDRIAEYGRDTDADVVRMFTLIPPVIVGLLFSTLRGYFDSRFGTDAGEGIVAALSYGRRLADLPTLILPFAVTLAVYPFVSEWASRKDKQRMADALVSMTRAMVFIFLPVALGMIILAQPIIATAFERGEFTPDDTVAVSHALIPYSAGLPFFAVEGAINNWYFALSDTATPNFIGASMAIVHILIAGFGVYALDGSIGVIAAALSVSKGIKVVILYILLRGRIGHIDRAAVVGFLGRLLVATAIMLGVVIGIERTLGPVLMPGGTLHRLGLLAACGGAGAVAYLISAWLLRIEEVEMVGGFLREKIGKRLGSG